VNQNNEAQDSITLSKGLTYLEFSKYLQIPEGLPVTWGRENPKTFEDEEGYQNFLKELGDKQVIRVTVPERVRPIEPGWRDA